MRPLRCTKYTKYRRCRVRLRLEQERDQPLRYRCIGQKTGGGSGVVTRMRRERLPLGVELVPLQDFLLSQ